VNAFEKANDEAFFFCVYVSIQPYTYASTTPKKDRKKKKNPSIGHTHTDTNLKERREYCAETMHDKMKCITNVGLLSREKKFFFKA